MTENACPVEAFSLSGRRSIGPYSDAVKAGNLLFLSGRIGLDYASMQLVKGGVGEQTLQCLVNIGEVLTMAGSSLNNVIKSTIFLADMADFASMNAVYGKVFTDRMPARSTVAVAGLPMDALVEIEVIAAL